MLRPDFPARRHLEIDHDTFYYDVRMHRRYIDITVPIRLGMALWPGDPKANVERTESMEAGDEYTVSRISRGSPVRTHVRTSTGGLRKG